MVRWIRYSSSRRRRRSPPDRLDVATRRGRDAGGGGRKEGAKSNKRRLKDLDTPVSKRRKFVQTQILEDGSVGRQIRPKKKVSRRRISPVKAPSTPLAVQTVFAYENAGGVWSNGRWQGPPSPLTGFRRGNLAGKSNLNLI